LIQAPIKGNVRTDLRPRAGSDFPAGALRKRVSRYRDSRAIDANARVPHFAGTCAPCERCYNRKSVTGDGDVRGKSVDVLIKIRETRALNPRISDVDEIDPDGVGSIADAY